MNERFELARQLRFESAHFLPNAPNGHKCRRLHGHSFLAEIWVSGQLDESAGWVMDFADIDHLLGPLREELDHHLLNDVPGLSNPTSEELSRWLWRRSRELLPGHLEVQQVVVRETCEGSVTYRAESAGSA